MTGKNQSRAADTSESKAIRGDKYVSPLKQEFIMFKNELLVSFAAMLIIAVGAFAIILEFF